ncbi:hypothetical protein B0J14DRAFT_309235 [Halenospora varia]|nr:hypothetical protein B0J14DRAFT_309235 [Halenospora varia]
MRREQNDHFKPWDGITNSRKVFTPLLARLALGGREARPEKRLQRLVERNFNRTTLLFRTMTAVLAISVLKPNSQRPIDPMREDPLLPSALSLYLYTQDGCHVGTAWVHPEEFYSKIVSSTSTGENGLDVEVAVIAGPVRADWRTRDECPTELQIMNALVDAGGNARDIIARHMMRGRYQGEISVIFRDMIKVHCPETWNLLALEKLELHGQFWEALEERIRQLNFPGHTKEAFDAFIEILLNTNSHMHVDINVRYFGVLLTGNLGGEISSGTGEAIEVFGEGEIREEALGLIDGLYFRDVILK